MPNALQAKLLRGIQEKKVLRFGSLEEVRAVSREVLALFYNYKWPGTVRKLEICHVPPYFRNV
jgi:transcriptional regulator with PAS, ATPase and Fis domain